MYSPPPDPRDRPAHKQFTWWSILVSYAMLASVPVVLWVVSKPLTGTVVFAAIVGLFIGARRSYRLVRCFYDCQGFAFDLGGKVRITITQTPANDSN